MVHIKRGDFKIYLKGKSKSLLYSYLIKEIAGKMLEILNNRHVRFSQFFIFYLKKGGQFAHLFFCKNN